MSRRSGGIRPVGGVARDAAPSCAGAATNPDRRRRARTASGARFFRPSATAREARPLAAVVPADISVPAMWEMGFSLFSGEEMMALDERTRPCGMDFRPRQPPPGGIMRRAELVRDLHGSHLLRLFGIDSTVARRSLQLRHDGTDAWPSANVPQLIASPAGLRVEVAVIFVHADK